MYTLGVKKSGIYIQIPQKLLDYTIPDWTYEIQLKTDKPVQNPSELATLIKTKFAEKLPEVKIHYIEINGDEVRIQLSASPLSWSTILTFLPLIFLVAGLTILLVAVWGVISAVPSWAWALLVIGIVVLWISPYVMETILPPPPPKETKK